MSDGKHGDSTRHQENIEKGAASECVPVEKLEALLEEWRNWNRSEHAMFDEGQRQCADELEELLNE